MSFVETVKRTLKIRIYHYGNDKSCTDFSIKMHQKHLAATGGTYSAPLDLARFNSGGRDMGRKKGETQEGINR